jgi:predicted nucleic acid-binding protein
MTIVDTTIWIDYLRGVRSPHTDRLDFEAGRQALGLTDLILFEILQGLTDESAFVRVRSALAPFPVFDTGGSAMAVAAARNYRALRARGHTVRKTVDCLVATFCILKGYSLLHHDRDYDPFENLLGLSVVHPGESSSR